eukprot:NODE_17948_length_918_cov_7.438685.p2 GENE.NODE_17948_length_918_cov_7.438685~~NODE_17948_length_918_cov_7.438685.p2  ORF type:complete len:213 (+),score=59.27 NODE_17948_length_918_cov_7.438685:78-716(+)
MATSPLQQLSPLAACVREAWLMQQLRRGAALTQLPACEKECTAPCDALLALFSEGCIAGVKPSLPWNEFWGEFQMPDNPVQRAASNVERYAGNYVNVVFAVAFAGALLQRPFPAVLVALLQVAALVLEPTGTRVPVGWWQSVVEFGGQGPLRTLWFRGLLVLAAHAGTWLYTVTSRVGIVLGLLLVLAHSLLRKRPLHVVARERLSAHFKRN